MKPVIPTKNDAQLAVELLEVILQRRLIEKKEAELKAYWKGKFTNLGCNAIVIGNLSIALTAKKRTDIDRKSLIAKHGIDFLKPFERITEYQQLDIREVEAISEKKAA